MKYLIILILILNASTLFAQRRSTLHDTTLTRAIIRDVFVGERSAQDFLIYTTISRKNTDYIIRSKPSGLWQYIKEAFKISDNEIIRTLLLNGYLLDTALKPMPANITFPESIADKTKSVQGSRLWTRRVVDNIYILYHRNDQKCIVYFHIPGAGTKVALLEKKDGTWKVSKSQMDYIE